MGDVLARRAARNPTAEAVVDVTTGQRLSFAALDLRTDQLANVLCGLAVQHGDRVAVLLPNGVEFIECFYGSAKIGAIVVLLTGG